MKSERLVSDRLSEKAINQISDLINKGALKPGDRLPSEGELSAQLGISRGTLREALKTLESVGYLSRKPGGGTYIRELSVADNSMALSDSLKLDTYADYLEVREMFEQKVVELAIMRASDRELEDVASTLHLLENSRPVSDIVLQFHFRLALAAKNHALVNLMRSNYRSHTNMVAAIDVDLDTVRRQMILKEHEAVIKAVQERDLEKARKAVSDHLRNARKYMEKRYKSLNVVAAFK